MTTPTAGSEEQDGWHERRSFSRADLTKARCVERPALYTAFGNKEALFRHALSRYHEQYMNLFQQALEFPTAREVAAHILLPANR